MSIRELRGFLQLGAPFLRLATNDQEIISMSILRHPIDGYYHMSYSLNS